MDNRAVFLDLNGTIVLPLKPESLDEMTLIPGADLAIQRLLKAGLLCPVVTGQPRIRVVKKAKSAVFIGDTITDAVNWIFAREHEDCDQDASMDT